MKHLIMFYIISTLMIESTAIIFGYFANRRFKNTFTLFYLIFMVTIFFDNVTTLIMMYLYLNADVASIVLSRLQKLETYIDILSLGSYSVSFVMMGGSLYKKSILPEMKKEVGVVLIAYTTTVVAKVLFPNFLKDYSIMSLTSLTLQLFLFATLVLLKRLSYLIEDKEAQKHSNTIFNMLLVLTPILMAFANYRFLGLQKIEFFARNINNIKPVVGPTVALFMAAYGIIISGVYLFGSQQTHEVSLDEKLKEFELTNREKEVVALVIQGLSNKEISDQLFIAEGTVKNHIYTIFRKTECKSRLDLINKFKTL